MQLLANMTTIALQLLSPFHLLIFLLIQLVINITTIAFCLFFPHCFSSLLLANLATITSPTPLRHYHVLKLMSLAKNTLCSYLFHHPSLLVANLAMTVLHLLVWHFFFLLLMVKMVKIALHFFFLYHLSLLLTA